MDIRSNIASQDKHLVYLGCMIFSELESMKDIIKNNISEKDKNKYNHLSYLIRKWNSLAKNALR